MKLSCHDYQLSMSLKIKCMWNIEWNSILKMSVPFKFYFILYDIAVLKQRRKTLHWPWRYSRSAGTYHTGLLLAAYLVYSSQ
jgi:hypothetical protein